MRVDCYNVCVCDGDYHLSLLLLWLLILLLLLSILFMMASEPNSSLGNNTPYRIPCHHSLYFDPRVTAGLERSYGSEDHHQHSKPKTAPARLPPPNVLKINESNKACSVVCCWSWLRGRPYTLNQTTLQRLCERGWRFVSCNTLPLQVSLNLLT